jgi:Ca-activated chloride channel family protein
VALLLAWTGLADAKGLLIPEEKSLPPLAMLNHKVNITIDDQVAVTRVEQTFRNHTDRQLEATYVFPVPKGASVNKFTMWVNGKEVSGELLEATKAREIYTHIVRRTQDPGLLEYMDNNLLRMRVFPILPRSDQKVALSYTAVANRDQNLVEYIYPLKTDGKATATLEEFAINATIKSQHSIQNVYSPTHSITIKRNSDHEIAVQFDKNQGLLDKDFQMFYSLGDKDVGLTAMMHRPIAAENGYFSLLISPKVEMSASNEIPRDMVLILDTSGSMRGPKMDQARKALRYCLDNLGPRDRFAVMNFATTVNKYRDKLVESSKDQLEQARKWVDALEATGGTAINDALLAGLDMRTGDMGRTFTIVFFTDGMPTIGETNWDRILKNVASKNTSNTRIFTFGVGHDVNATMLDTLADQTRAVSTYVRPEEDIEAKVSGLYSKISHPVLANLKLSAGKEISFLEVYPPQLPDLFHGGQLVVLGRYSGKGPAAITLTGTVGMETREFVYETTFPEKTGDEKGFTEHLWARRKVGYMLDQIRANGEKKELVDEVTALAKKYGITTPYTSWLIVPDGPAPVAGRRLQMDGTPDVRFTNANGGVGGGGFGGGAGGPGVPAGLAPRGAPGAGPASKPQSVTEFAKENQKQAGDAAAARNFYAETQLKRAGEARGAEKEALQGAKDKKEAFDEAKKALAQRDREKVQGGKLGVDLSEQTNNLRNQSRLEMTALRRVANRNCVELGGVWLDDGYDAKMPTVAVKAMSDAYFRLLEKQPQLKEVFKLGNHLVWVTPNGTALVLDTSEGKEKLSDAEIDKLFVEKK